MDYDVNRLDEPRGCLEEVQRLVDLYQYERADILLGIARVRALERIADSLEAIEILMRETASEK